MDGPAQCGASTRARALAALCAPPLAAAGCASSQSTLDPASEPARKIETLWWVMMVGGWVVFGGTIFLLVLAWLRRGRKGWPLVGSSDRFDVGIVVAFGMGIPLAALVALFGYANFHVLSATAAPKEEDTELTVEVVGHQWFWEVRYPGTAAVTANEIHLPARTRVSLEVRTADVIHSFWVPRLNRKIDMIPGRTNRILLYAEEPGVYRGQCAEFCGLQHAHMAFLVFADPPEEFRAWLAREAQPRAAPESELEQRGEEVFLAEACAGCHTIRGTEASGRIGPDLTHLASRTTLAAVTIPNRTGYLGGWVLDPQHVKPGNEMPGIDLPGPDFQALLAYLESLE